MGEVIPLNHCQTKVQTPHFCIQGVTRTNPPLDPPPAELQKSSPHPVSKSIIVLAISINI